MCTRRCTCGRTHEACECAQLARGCARLLHHDRPAQLSKQVWDRPSPDPSGCRFPSSAIHFGRWRLPMGRVYAHTIRKAAIRSWAQNALQPRCHGCVEGRGRLQWSGLRGASPQSGSQPDTRDVRGPLVQGCLHFVPRRVRQPKRGVVSDTSPCPPLAARAARPSTFTHLCRGHRTFSADTCLLSHAFTAVPSARQRP